MALKGDIGFGGGMIFVGYQEKIRMLIFCTQPRTLVGYYNNSIFNKQVMLEKKQNGNWKKYAYLYNKNRNIDFLCSCGKIYTSFPALYLHCQRKHGKKISAGLVKQECSIAQIGKTNTYRYVLQEEDIQEQESANYATSLMQEISMVMTAYNEEKEELGKAIVSPLARYPTGLWRMKVLRKFMEFLAG